MNNVQEQQLRVEIRKCLNNHSGGCKLSQLITNVIATSYENHWDWHPTLEEIESLIQRSFSYLEYEFDNREKWFVYGEKNHSC